MIKIFAGLVLFCLIFGFADSAKASNHEADQLFKKATAESLRMETQDQALKHYAAAIALEPRNAVYHAGQAALLYDLEEDEAALVACNKAIKCNAKNSDAWRVKAKVEGRLKRPNDGIASLNVAMTLLPLTAPLLQERGRLYRLAGRYREAEKDLDQAIVMQPNLAGAYIERIMVNTKLKQWNKVISDCSIGLKTDAMHHEHVLQQRSEAKFELHDYDGATDDLKRALKHSPDNIKIHQALLKIYKKVGDTKGVSLETEKIRQLNEIFAK